MTKSKIDWNNDFKTENDCEAYLYDLRWNNDLRHKCPNCKKPLAHTTNRHMQCTGCKNIISVTSGTLLHHIKFPLPDVFRIIYMHVSNPKISHYKIAQEIDRNYINVRKFRVNKLSQIKMHRGMTFEQFMLAIVNHKKVKAKPPKMKKLLNEKMN